MKYLITLLLLFISISSKAQELSRDSLYCTIYRNEYTNKTISLSHFFDDCEILETSDNCFKLPANKAMAKYLSCDKCSERMYKMLLQYIKKEEDSDNQVKK